jgi:predicted ribosomally synthesized peptide with SipW-like signal peptide
MPRPLIRNLLATIVVLGVLIALIGGAVFSAYTSVSSNDGNQFTAGTIGLSDNDAGTALFNVSGFVPGDSYTKCLTVDYTSTGGVQSDVHLYGQSGGSGLVTYLNLQIRRGTQPATNTPGDCAVYEITIDVQNNNAAQGLSATQDFSFEAHNL